MENQDFNAIEALDFQEENEFLTEFCASESTLGGSVRYREASVGRFL